jgi:hypothetical protein
MQSNQNNQSNQSSHRSRRGTTLVETIVALGILACLTVGILQMFTLALAVNQASAARTHLTYKAQQVAEAIRFVAFISKSQPTVYAQAPMSSAGIPSLPWTSQAQLTTYALPWDSNDPNYQTQMQFWGPQTANIVDGSQAPYKLTYKITDPGSPWPYQVIVTAIPVTGGTAKLGSYMHADQSKKVEYVTGVTR